MTDRREDATTRPSHCDTTGSGRGDSVGTGRDVETRQTTARCRRCAGLAVAALLAALTAGCGQTVDPIAALPRHRQPRVDAPVRPAPAPSWALRYYDGYTAEVLRGDLVATRTAYRAVLDQGEGDGALVARAALRLAEMEAAAGRRHVAIDLTARAAALGRKDPLLLDWARRLQSRLAAVRAQDIEVRGPPAGTALTGVSPAAASLFAHAEELLAAYHRRPVRARLEDLNASLRAKRAAMEEAVRAYRQVVALSEPAATAAAEFRIAGLYYDLSLSTTFDLPGELEVSVASRLRQSLRSQAVADRKKARAGYLLSLEAARGGGAAARPWGEAASLGLRSVEDLLGTRE
jgi:hypothetical protein